MTYLRCICCDWDGRFLNDWSAFGAWLHHWESKHESTKEGK